jgi:hypothetical protein
MGAQHDDKNDLLLDAVDALTKKRSIHTTITDDETGEWLKVHTEIHPPLLTMLMDGASSQGGSKSSDPGIPIDAAALEMHAQIRDLVRLWCKQSGTVWWPYDLLYAVRAWYIGHVNLHRAGKVSDEADRDITHMVQGWVRMIESKFDPQDKSEWTFPCPARVMDDEPHRCDARRVTIDGVERFAIGLNLTLWTAECVVCGTKWSSSKAIQELRYESNVWEQEKIDAKKLVPIVLL